MILAIKAILIGVTVVGVSELAKKNVTSSAILASLPLTSIVAMLWMHWNGQGIDTIQKFSTGVFWLVIPSLAFFALLPAVLKVGLSFYPAILISSGVTFGIYLGYAKLLATLNIDL